jgi:exodeoxyribonuclease-3
MAIRVATWNVNSIRVREATVRAWLERHSPDVLCLQETKVVDEKFPRATFESLGYHVAISGQPTYNGVAILSKTPLQDCVLQLPDDASDAPRRFLAATTAGIRVVNVYVPNGGTLDSDKYRFKLAWLARLRRALDGFDRSADLLVCGDFNVAPEARDVYDPIAFENDVLFHVDVRNAFAEIVAWGLKDAFRLHNDQPGQYSWWDYRLNAFKRNLGLRIDHILLSGNLSGRCTACEVDTMSRAEPQPSDHAPVSATLA